MKKLLFIATIFLSNLCFSQDEGSFQSNEIISFPKDSLEFYIAKYKDNSKSIKILPIKAMRVSYIYLDGSKLSNSEIDKLRKKIISAYKSGKPFADLANQYTMDLAKDGDLNWFDQGMMVQVFEDAVLAHKKGDIFMVDIPDKKWYYVVLKTFDDVQKISMEIEKN